MRRGGFIFIKRGKPLLNTHRGEANRQPHAGFLISASVQKVRR
jgi:hypothetical protein